MRLFEAKVLPKLTYGLEVISDGTSTPKHGKSQGKISKESDGSVEIHILEAYYVCNGTANVFT